jgi:hypothetical protein
MFASMLSLVRSFVRLMQQLLAVDCLPPSDVRRLVY